MNELDELWSEMLDSALDNARAEGRGGVADYIALKATNDQIRTRSTDWLIDLLIEIASDASRELQAMTIEREEPHSFPYNGANLVGSLLRVRHGIRAVTVEAGWPRTPTDGFMRDGALAAARIRHFGLRERSMDLILTIIDGMPQWQFTHPGGQKAEFRQADMHRHLKVLLSEE